MSNTNLFKAIQAISVIISPTVYGHERIDTLNTLNQNYIPANFSSESDLTELNLKPEIQLVNMVQDVHVARLNLSIRSNTDKFTQLTVSNAALIEKLKIIELGGTDILKTDPSEILENSEEQNILIKMQSIKYSIDRDIQLLGNHLNRNYPRVVELLGTQNFIINEKEAACSIAAVCAAVFVAAVHNVAAVTSMAAVAVAVTITLAVGKENRN